MYIYIYPSVYVKDLALAVISLPCLMGSGPFPFSYLVRDWVGVGLIGTWYSCAMRVQLKRMTTGRSGCRRELQKRDVFRISNMSAPNFFFIYLFFFYFFLLDLHNPPNLDAPQSFIEC